MNHPDPSKLYDGAVDHRGDALPYLSKSAKNMKMEELLKTPMPKYSGSTPGSYFGLRSYIGFVGELAPYSLELKKHQGYPIFL